MRGRTRGAIRDKYFPDTAENDLEVAPKMAARLGEGPVRAYLHPVTSWGPGHRFPELEIELACAAFDEQRESACPEDCVLDALMVENGDDPARMRPWTWAGPWRYIRLRAGEAGYNAAVGCRHEHWSRHQKEGAHPADWSETAVDYRCHDCGSWFEWEAA